MDTRQLMKIIETRKISDEGNPTRKNLLFEIYNALQKQEEYESKDDSLKDMKSQ